MTQTILQKCFTNVAELLQDLAQNTVLLSCFSVKSLYCGPGLRLYLVNKEGTAGLETVPPLFWRMETEPVFHITCFSVRFFFTHRTVDRCQRLSGFKCIRFLRFHFVFTLLNQVAETEGTQSRPVQISMTLASFSMILHCHIYQPLNINIL